MASNDAPPESTTARHYGRADSRNGDFATGQSPDELILPALWLTVCISVLFLALPQLDLVVSAAFRIPDGGFPVSHNPVALFLRDSIRLADRLAEAASVLTLLVTLAARGRGLAIPLRVWIYAAAAQILIPGLIGNILLKHHWGRARPEQVLEFGGTAAFTPAWLLSDACTRNSSFVSGEAMASATLAMLVWTLVLPAMRYKRRFRAGLWVATSAALSGFLRIAMGRHFLSDVVVGALLAVLGTLALHRLFGIGATRGLVTWANLRADLDTAARSLARDAAAVRALFTRSNAGAIPLGVTGIALVTLWRVALLPFDRLDLFVDDAQYWHWGHELAWGYFSKPPLIGWILGASSWMGTDDPFWIRLPLPLIHAGTALVTMAIGHRLFDARTGALAGFAFCTLPGVALGSLLVSTDTPLLFAWAAAILAWLRLVRSPSPVAALALGAAIGFGSLAKYTMLFFSISAAICAALLPQSRITRRDAALAGGLAFLLFAPNLVWNAANEFSTVVHTVDRAAWIRAQVRPLEVVEFLAGQFAIAGPVIFAAWLVVLAATLRGGSAAAYRFLVAFSLPSLVIVCIQALIAGANPNWAAPAHLAVALAAIALIASRPRLLAVGLGINLAVTLALPLLAIFPEALRLPSGKLLCARYLGRAEVSHRAAAIARAEGLVTLVFTSRDMLADAFYTLREGGFAIYAEPSDGPPSHHYAQRHPLSPGTGEVLYLTNQEGGPDCRGGAVPIPVASWTPEAGYAEGRVHYAFRVARTCWYGSQG